MPNVLLISSSAQSSVKSDARMAYVNYADTAHTVVASHDTTATARLYDGMTTLAWRPGVSGASSVEFQSEFEATGSGSKFPAITYVAVTGVNWQSSGTSLTITDENDVTIAEASGYRDNQPVFVVIAEAVYSSLKFKFSSTATNLEVGEIHFGPTIDFPCEVSVGEMPARWHNNDIVTLSTTETNQFGPSTVRARGTTEQFNIAFVDVDWMESTWRTFINAAKGVPIFFVWNKDRQDHAVYGNWEANEPRFKTSNYSEINMTIRGVA